MEPQPKITCISICTALFIIFLATVSNAQDLTHSCEIFKIQRQILEKQPHLENYILQNTWSTDPDALHHVQLRYEFNFTNRSLRKYSNDSLVLQVKFQINLEELKFSYQKHIGLDQLGYEINEENVFFGAFIISFENEHYEPTTLFYLNWMEFESPSPDDHKKWTPSYIEIIDKGTYCSVSAAYSYSY
jgi:hypothetical protein